MNYGLQSVEKAIMNSKNIVVLMGRKVATDCGCLNMALDGSGMSDAYDIELEFGYSPEEIMSASFYNTRLATFYKFYHKWILNKLGEPDAALRVIKRMQDDGKVLAVVTRSIFGLPERAGINWHINMHGSVYENRCPRCSRTYGIDYMMAAKNVPLCESCGQPVRPQITLAGEMIPNRWITEAADAVSRADTLLILDCAMHGMLVQDCIDYFDGNKIILINEEENYSDNIADIVVKGKPCDILPMIYK